MIASFAAVIFTEYNFNQSNKSIWHEFTIRISQRVSVKTFIFILL